MKKKILKKKFQKTIFFTNTQPYIFVKVPKHFGPNYRFQVEYSFRVGEKKPRQCLMTKLISLFLVFV